MTTELVIETAEIRLLQTATLIEWLTKRFPDRNELRAALEAIESARAIIESLTADSG